MDVAKFATNKVVFPNMLGVKLSPTFKTSNLLRKIREIISVLQE